MAGVGAARLMFINMAIRLIGTHKARERTADQALSGEVSYLGSYRGGTVWGFNRF